MAVPRVTLLYDDHGRIVGVQTYSVISPRKGRLPFRDCWYIHFIILFYILYSDPALPLLFSAIFSRSGIVYAKLFSLLCYAHHPPAWMLLTGLEDGMNLLSGCFAKILVLVLFVLL